MLYIIPTPIGNLKDITLRAIETLQSIDSIICEDSRRTSILLNHYQIKKPMVVMNDFNEVKILPNILNQLKSGKNFALVSDAGTPLVSDPGFKLVRECIKENIAVDSLPGPTAAITALTLSSLPPDKFLFLGYLPEKLGHRIKTLKQVQNSLADINPTTIIYVAPHKLLKTLDNLKEVFGDIEITLASELTKIHQKTASKKISDWINFLPNPKGEYTLLFNLPLKK